MCSSDAKLFVDFINRCQCRCEFRGVNLSVTLSTDSAMDVIVDASSVLCISRVANLVWNSSWGWCISSTSCLIVSKLVSNLTIYCQAYWQKLILQRWSVVSKLDWNIFWTYLLSTRSIFGILSCPVCHRLILSITSFLRCLSMIISSSLLLIL